MSGYTFEEYQNKINEKYSEEQLQLLVFNGVKEPAKIKCLQCGTIYSYKKAESITRKQKKVLCHKCLDSKKKLERYKQSLKDRFPQDSLEVITFSGQDKPGSVKCINCGEIYSYSTMSNSLTKTRNVFCSKCFPFKSNIMENKRKEFKDFISKSDKWDLTQDIDTTIHSDTLIQCKCKKCNKISKKTIYDYMRGRGCIYCCGNNVKTTEEFKKLLDRDYELLSEYKNANTKVCLKHDCGFIYEVTPHNYLTGKRCPQCMRKQSKGEKKIEQYLLYHNIEYEKEYSVKINNHILRFDFFLPIENLFIEFQGIQHCEPVEHFGGEKRFQKQIEYDSYKKEYCKEHLIEIPYYDLDNIALILDNALKFNDYCESK